jgi:hypothetical protein
MAIIHPVTGATLRTGLKMRPVQHPHLKLKNYLLRGMPNPPADWDETPAAVGALHQMYLNDTLGCCVIASLAHKIGVWMANAGNPFMLTDSDIKRLYSAIGGYVDGDPSTDQGCDLQEAVAYVVQKGPFFPSNAHKALGYVGVNINDATEMRIAVWLFGYLDLGYALPDNFQAPGGDGFTFSDLSGNPNMGEGHCMGVPGRYGSSTLGCSTWGMIGDQTDQWVQKFCVGQCFATLSADSLNQASKKAPNGFDITQLQADLQAQGG